MNIYLVGIKGSGMAALACYLHQLGHFVRGSDIDTYVFTEDELRKKNILINNFETEDVSSFDLVVIGNSFTREYKNQITYIDAINLFSSKRIISVAGTHGKTTTTTFLSTITNSSAIIGDGTCRFNLGEHLVVESCEYKANFLGINADYILITSIDLDHIDYFKNIEETVELFRLFTTRSKRTIYYGDYIKLDGANCTSYGFSQTNDIVIVIDSVSETGSVFSFEYDGKTYQINAQIYGTHNILNLAGSVIMALNLGYKFEELCIDRLKMPRLRLEIEEHQGEIIITDYAHHPAEVEATLNSIAQMYPEMKIRIVFQFHTYSRARFFIEFFRKVFKEFEVYLTPIFASNRENEEFNDTFELLKGKLEAFQFTDLRRNKAKKNYVTVFMGAGDIYNYKNMYLRLD